MCNTLSSWAFDAILIAIFWVYADAQHHGQSGCLPALLVFVLGLPGLVVWLVLRKSFQQEYPVSTPFPLIRQQPSESPGRQFYRTLTADYLLLKQGSIDHAEFEQRKEKAIHGLQEFSGRQSPTDFFGEVIVYIDNGVLNKVDIGKIKGHLLDSQRVEAGGSKLMRLGDQQLMKDYLRFRDADLKDELSGRGLPIEPTDLVAKLIPTNLIDLYRETKDLIYADELRRRGLDSFL